MQIGSYYINIWIGITGLVFLVGLLIQLYYYLFVFMKITKSPQKKRKNKKIPVSVIICAQNEEKNLKSFLPEILEQDYPEYEVIVVDDCSTDSTAEVLAEFKGKYPNLKVTFINKDDKFSHGKKLALTVGIKAATNEWLLLTDADCKPVSKKWISSMSANFTEKTSIVLGYGGYLRNRTILSNLIRFDTLFIAIQYLTFALKGKPYMGVGRNLAYRKSLFFENKGFSRHYHILSGDDDIFINEVATRDNTQIEISPKSMVLSLPQKTWGNWFKQKIRHFQTGKFYKFRTKFVLGIEVLSRLLFYYSFILLMLIVSKDLIYYVLGLFFIRFILQIIVYKHAIIRFNEKNLLVPSLIYDFILPYFNFIFIAINLFSSGKNKWM
ncbi:glycosyltransferase [Bacteroidota bacterium]